jgi:NAD-dependent dihydropyrimidine dehydrogenase PreA subunit
MTKKPVINIELCTGCAVCVDTCGHNVLEMKGDKAFRARPDDCDGAGICAGVCPVGAIKMEQI